MKKNIFRVVMILGIMAGLGYSVVVSRRNDIRMISVGGAQFRAEVVDTPRKMALGLGQRETLCQDCGMIFVFPEKKSYSFWMKGMRFPLDIIWFNSVDGRIIHLEKNIAPDFKETLIPAGVADRVLEINAGLSDTYGIKVGDLVTAEK